MQLSGSIYYRINARWKSAFLGILALGSLVGAFFVKPIPQDPNYHRLADGRPLFGVPNAGNVLSNLPFLAAGLYGLTRVRKTRTADYAAPWVRVPWIVLTGSLFVTGFGSSYYHWAPTDATLFWDRLPMAVGFSSLLGIMVIERVDLRIGRILWAPLVLAAVGSLVFWRLGGDLRFYGLLQGWAIVLVPIILLLFPSLYTRDRDWYLMLVCYGLAKVFEKFDTETYGALRVVSGHTLKHLFAGGAAFVIAWHAGARARTNSSDAARPGSA